MKHMLERRLGSMQLHLDLTTTKYSMDIILSLKYLAQKNTQATMLLEDLIHTVSQEIKT